MVGKISSLSTSQWTKLSLTIETDDVTSSRMDVETHRRLLTNLIIDGRKRKGWGGGGGAKKALWFNWLNIRYKEVKNPKQNESSTSKVTGCTNLG